MLCLPLSCAALPRWLRDLGPNKTDLGLKRKFGFLIRPRGSKLPVVSFRSFGECPSKLWPMNESTKGDIVSPTRSERSIAEFCLRPDAL